MIHIVCGPDGGGKSVLAAYIAKMLGVGVRHRSQPKNKKEKDQMMFDYLEDIAAANSKDVVWDRCFYSELVYGVIMRDKSVLTEDQVRTLEVFIKQCGGGIIYYCKQDPIALWKAANERGEEYIKDWDTFSMICREYDKVFLESKHVLPVVIYDKDINENLLKL